MPIFSMKSLRQLGTCHSDLQRIAHHIIKTYDITVVWGYRDGATQNRMFDEGVTRLEYPYSKHNRIPSFAFDIVPYPTLYDSSEQLYYLGGRVKEFCMLEKIPIVWGGDWKSFPDLAHYELKE